MAGSHRQFWSKQAGLVWSNPDADDSTHIRAALLQPRYGRLLEIALEFGLDRVRREWEVLGADCTPEVERARGIVERILNHIEKGFALASSPD